LDSHIHIPGGFEPGWIYELSYTSRDPLVLGLGHVAMRDFVSFLRYEAEDHLGHVNPLRERGWSIEKVYAWGRSQTGRCLRDFVDRGFNGDAEERRVFDGILPHVAGAGRIWLNHRFANADASGGQQYEDHFNPADSFSSSTPALSGKPPAGSEGFGVGCGHGSDLLSPASFSAGRHPASRVAVPSPRS
jgi:hypothetical protein